MCPGVRVSRLCSCGSVILYTIKDAARLEALCVLAATRPSLVSDAGMLRVVQGGVVEKSSFVSDPGPEIRVSLTSLNMAQNTYGFDTRCHSTTNSGDIPFSGLIPRTPSAIGSLTHQPFCHAPYGYLE